MFWRVMIVAIALWYVLPHSAGAAAWTQKKGSGQFIGSTPRYNQDINPFIEYGLTNTVTVGASPSFQYTAYEPNDTSYSNATMAYSEVFFRSKILDYKKFVLSAQPLVKLPGIYKEDTNPQLGNRQLDAEIRLLAGYGFTWAQPNDGQQRPYAGQYHFINTELAYRTRAGEGLDELRVDSTLGLRLIPDWLLLCQTFSTVTLVNDAAQAKLFHDHADGYREVKLQGSIVRQLTANQSLQLGVFSDVRGRNTGNGIGGLVSLWYNF